MGNKNSGKKKSQKEDTESKDANADVEVENRSEEKGLSTPTATTSRQTAVINLPLDVVWKLIRPCTFEWQKNIVKSSTKNGQSVTIMYKDGTAQTIVPTEISDKNYTVSWSMITSDPVITYTSRDDTINLTEITSRGFDVKPQTFIEWDSYFSDDADLPVIEDSNAKKREAFKDLLKL